MKKILFLCTGNSCRSQMAEGWGKELWPEKYNFCSAGSKKHGLNPFAIEVMKEVGVDISEHSSQTLDEFDIGELDYIFTVCSDAHETCPVLPGVKIIHIGFDDPPRLTENLKGEKRLAVYRRVRDEIKDFIANIESHLI